MTRDQWLEVVIAQVRLEMRAIEEMTERGEPVKLWIRVRLVDHLLSLLARMDFSGPQGVVDGSDLPGPIEDV